VTINFPAFTSNPPQLHHKKTTSTHPLLPKPSAKAGPHPPKKYCKAPLRGSVSASSGNDDGGHFVLIFEVEDLGAPNPRKLSDYGECPRDVPKPQCHEVSLENAASPNSLILWGFSRVFGVAKAENEHT
jgi:hypothetical protein